MNTLKIKHTLAIQEDGVTIKWQITDVIWNDNDRNDRYEIRSKKKDHSIESFGKPELRKFNLYVWGLIKEHDKDIISHTYDSPEEAQEMMDFIMEHTVKDYEYVYVSDESEEDALKEKDKRILLFTFPWNTYKKYACVWSWHEHDFEKWSEYSIITRKYAVPIPKEEEKVTIEMTKEEYNKVKSVLWFDN